jgi:hypothetical protein
MIARLGPCRHSRSLRSHSFVLSPLTAVLYVCVVGRWAGAAAPLPINEAPCAALLATCSYSDSGEGQWDEGICSRSDAGQFYDDALWLEAEPQHVGLWVAVHAAGQVRHRPEMHSDFHPVPAESLAGTQPEYRRTSASCPMACTSGCWSATAYDTPP